MKNIINSKSIVWINGNYIRGAVSVVAQTAPAVLVPVGAAVQRAKGWRCIQTRGCGD